MLRNARICLSICLSAICLLALPAAAQQPSAPAAGQPRPAGGGTTEPVGPRWVLDEPVFEFGTAWSGMVITYPFVIRNVGSEPLIIFETLPNCACSIADDFTREIPPGGSGKIPFTLNTAGKDGPVSETISVRTNDRTEPNLTLEMRGIAKTLLRLEVTDDAIVRPGTTEFNEIRYRSGHFGRIKADQKLRRVIQIENIGDVDLDLRLLTVIQDAPRFDAEMKELKPKKLYEVTITGEQPFPEGATNSQVILATGIPEFPRYQFSLFAYVPPRIEAWPPKIVVDPRYPIQPIRGLTITNNGTKHYEITSIAASNPEFRLKMMPPSPHNPMTREIKVKLPLGAYRPPPYGDVIRIETSDEEYPVVDVFVLPEVGVEATPRPADKPLLFHPGEMN